MVSSLVSSSVSTLGAVTTYSVKTSHPKNETSSQSINIGNLDEEGSIISVSDQGKEALSAVSTSFTAQAGIVTLSESFGNIVTKVATRFQLSDSQGNIIADNLGTAEQKAAFTKWQAGTLQITAGTYTATATPSSTSSGTPSLTIQKAEQQGTALQVNSTLTGSDTSEYYDFSLSGSNIKLDFSSANSKSARIVLYNSSGTIVADSQGNAYQKANYQSLTSGTGLSAKSGDYMVKVTYARNADTTKDLKYTMNLYSGSSYSVVYKNTVKAQPYDSTAVGSVTAASNAELYTKTSYNLISATADTAINIGWLQKDKSMLDVYSQLTSADNKEYYSFTLQQGDNLKFGFNTKTSKDTSGLRVQLMNSTGTYVIADSAGTAEQQAAYKKLTTTNGLDSTAGTYVVKISYLEGVTKSDTTYEFGIYSGSTYAAEYKTTASAQTYANALLQGQVKGSSNASAMAAYLTSLNNGDDTSTALTDALKSYI